MEKKIVSKRVKVGAIAGALVLLAAGVSVYASGALSQGSITEAEAKQIALAEVKGADASNITKFKKDNDSGREEYDVEIIYDGFEYDFEISAKDGRIFDRSKEKADLEDLARLEAKQEAAKEEKQPASSNEAAAGSSSGGSSASNSAPATAPSGSASSDIGLEKAKAIALGQVSGASAGNIVKAYQDYDDGRVEYDVKIQYDGYEYEFEIDGASGRILGKDVDRIEYDDDWDDRYDD